MPPGKNYLREVNLDFPADWDSFVSNSPQGSVFNRSWFIRSLNINFNVLTIRQKNGDLVAGVILPIFKKNSCKMPILTQVLGILFTKDIDQNSSGNIQIQEEIIDFIEQFDSFYMQFHWAYENWLPFFWYDYKDTTRYTYVLEDIKDHDKVLKGFHKSRRSNIKKAKKYLAVEEDLGAQNFYKHHQECLKQEGKTLKYSQQEFTNIYDAAYKYSSGKSFFAQDSSGVIHSAIFIIFDILSAYYLVSAVNKNSKYRGANSLLVYEAIKYVSQYTDRWDFEGSMHRNIAEAFRRFGAKQFRYFAIFK